MYSYKEGEEIYEGLLKYLASSKQKSFRVRDLPVSDKLKSKYGFLVIHFDPSSQDSPTFGEFRTHYNDKHPLFKDVKTPWWRERTPADSREQLNKWLNDKSIKDLDPIIILSDKRRKDTFIHEWIHFKQVVYSNVILQTDYDSVVYAQRAFNILTIGAAANLTNIVNYGYELPILASALTMVIGFINLRKAYINYFSDPIEVEAFAASVISILKDSEQFNRKVFLEKIGPAIIPQDEFLDRVKIHVHPYEYIKLSPNKYIFDNLIYQYYLDQMKGK